MGNDVSDALVELTSAATGSKMSLLIILISSRTGLKILNLSLIPTGWWKNREELSDLLIMRRKIKLKAKTRDKRNKNFLFLQK